MYSASFSLDFAPTPVAAPTPVLVVVPGAILVLVLGPVPVPAVVVLAPVPVVAVLVGAKLILAFETVEAVDIGDVTLCRWTARVVVDARSGSGFAMGGLVVVLAVPLTDGLPARVAVVPVVLAPAMVVGRVAVVVPGRAVVDTDGREARIPAVAVEGGLAVDEPRVLVRVDALRLARAVGFVVVVVVPFATELPKAGPVRAAVVPVVVPAVALVPVGFLAAARDARSAAGREDGGGLGVAADLGVPKASHQHTLKLNGPGR